MDLKLIEKILAEIEEKEIVTMCCDVINIPSPTGEELPMAHYMQYALQQLGLKVTWQEVEEGRANVVGRWLGTGGGKNLMFNGHLQHEGCAGLLYTGGPSPAASRSQVARRCDYCRGCGRD